MSIAYSIEARTSFLERQLVEFGYSLSNNWIVGRDALRRLLVNALGYLFPDEIVHRPKQGFTIPFALWMGQHAAEVMDLREDSIVLREGVERVWADFKGGDTHWARVRFLVFLNVWLKQH